MPRCSCRSPLANQMRLILHTAAYCLMLTVRDAIPKTHALATAEFNTIPLRLLKLGARTRLFCCLPGRHFDPPHRGSPECRRGRKRRGRDRPGNPSRKPPTPTQDQRQRRNRRLDNSRPSPRQRAGSLATRHRGE